MIDLKEEQRIILNTVKQISEEKIRPRAAEIDETGEFSWETAQIFADNGILTPLLPEKYGGIGAEYLLFSMILEEISKHCASSALLLIAQADGMLPILEMGDETMKDFPVERMMRDAKLVQIYTGTNQVLRVVAAREILL
ncbi:MAG: acyl-CoA dehydrogenase family protein [Nitrospinota bacterium]